MSETISRAAGIELVQNLTAATMHRDVDRLMSLYHRDAVAVSPVFGEVIGKNAIAATWQRFFSALQNIQFQASDVLVDGERIAMTGRMTATTGPGGCFGSPANGAEVDDRVVVLLTVTDGRISRDERIYDSAHLLKRFEIARCDEQIRLASEVQNALLPLKAMFTPFCSSVGRAEPCRAIGGDFFDFLDLPSGDAGILIGDVAGKGVAAGLLAALIQGMVSVEAITGGGPASVLARINSRLSARHVRSRFAKLVYCMVSANGQLTYCNAGHNAPAVLSRGRVQRLTNGRPHTRSLTSRQILGGVDQGRFG